MICVFHHLTPPPSFPQGLSALVSPRFVVVSPGGFVPQDGGALSPRGGSAFSPRSAPSGGSAAAVAPTQSGLLRLWAVRHFAPSFEALLIVQKLLLVVFTNLIASKHSLRPLAQIGVHVFWIALVSWCVP